MRSKSWLFILVIGIVGFCALGFLTKFALESNPNLVRIGKLKQAIAQDFSPEGVGEVSVRSLPGKRGYELRVESPRAAHQDLDGFAERLAEHFRRKYAGTLPAYLKITLVEPGRFGCRGETAYFEKEVSTHELVVRMDLKEAIARWEASLGAGFRLLGAEHGDPLRLKVEVPAPAGDADLARRTALLRSKAEEHLAAGKGRTVVIALWTGGAQPRLLAEERIERPASRKRTPARPPAGAPGKSPARAPAGLPAPELPAAPPPEPAPAPPGR